jgi:hypothetical protein
MGPLFKRVVLKILKTDIPELFAEVETKPRPILHDYSHDCDIALHNNIGKEVMFNGIINEVLEDNENYQLIITHETNLLYFY